MTLDKWQRAKHEVYRERERENSGTGLWWLLVAMFAFHRETGKFHIVQLWGVVKLRMGPEEHAHGKKRSEENA